MPLAAISIVFAKSTWLGSMTTTPDEQPREEIGREVNDLFDSLELTQAIETEEFRVFLDHIPIAIVISRVVGGSPRIAYANKAFETLTGQAGADIRGKGWVVLDAFLMENEPHLRFSEALLQSDDFLGTFRRDGPKVTLVEAYSGVIENEDAGKTYCIVALIDVTERERAQQEEFARRLRDKDMLLKELQHRVKNNLQLLTALIRLDARTRRHADSVSLDRLASRVESLQLLYQDLTADGLGQTIDLGHYLSQIATSVVRTYAAGGIRLDLKVDHAPVSVNIAMPVGLLVNELLTNAFKYAFAGRDGGGTITIRCLHETESAYRVVVADDGIGLPDNSSWPVPGKLGALILQCLHENAPTTFRVETGRDQGTRVSIDFIHKPAVAKAN
jgi:PAS domain S-box-containing protein